MNQIGNYSISSDFRADNPRIVETPAGREKRDKPVAVDALSWRKNQKGF